MDYGTRLGLPSGALWMGGNPGLSGYLTILRGPDSGRLPSKKCSNLSTRRPFTKQEREEIHY